jgi:RES domain-containing protein
MVEGRWHTLGERMVYFGASAAIVVLERLVHTIRHSLPEDLRLGYFEIPGNVSQVKVEDFSALSPNWIHDKDATRRIGGRWWRESSSCLLIVPSAILPEESNVILNPGHPEAGGLRLVRERPFSFDPRLI